MSVIQYAKKLQLFVLFSVILLVSTKPLITVPILITNTRVILKVMSIIGNVDIVFLKFMSLSEHTFVHDS